MRIRPMHLAWLALLPLAAGADIQTFAPRVLQDGSHIWIFTTTWPLKGGEPMLLDRIAQHLANAHWCLDGWEIVKRTEAGGAVVIEGKCLSKQP